MPNVYSLEFTIVPAEASSFELLSDGVPNCLVYGLLENSWHTERFCRKNWETGAGLDQGQMKEIMTSIMRYCRIYWQAARFKAQLSERDRLLDVCLITWNDHLFCSEIINMPVFFFIFAIWPTSTPGHLENQTFAILKLMVVNKFTKFLWHVYLSNYIDLTYFSWSQRSNSVIR
jgi:hypothetical protein